MSLSGPGSEGQGTLSHLRRRVAALDPLRQRIRAALDSGAGLILILDFDGTLTPIAKRPSAATLDPGVRGVLQRLTAFSRFKLAIVSGRSLQDIRGRVGLRGVVYGGCHGLEIKGEGLRFRDPLARSLRRGLRSAARTLEMMTSRVPGAQLEWKGLAVAVHHRGVAPSRLRSLFRTTKEVAARHGLVLLLGVKVWDLVPPGTQGKSGAVSLILRHLKARVDGLSAFTVFAGDDATDADAFLTLRGRGVAVQVGEPRWTADYHLANVSEVHALLRWLERELARVQPHRDPRHS